MNMPCRRTARAFPLLFLSSLLGLALCAASALAEPAAAEPERAAAPGPARYLLVKAMGQGTTQAEAEEDALKNARVLAARHLEPIGGDRVLFPAPEGQRVATLHHFPQMGFSPARSVVLLELRLRGQTEPLPADSPLLELRATAKTGMLELSANRPCEAVAALAQDKGEPELLPGGSQSLRLTPGKPVQQPLPRLSGQSLHVLACSGGLAVPASPETLGAAFAKAKTGKPHPSVVQGVVSDCVELRLGQVPGSPRSMRQKSSETPVNMTGAAGRESGLPIGSSAP